MAETILLVDDEPGIRSVLSISLEDSGYQVLTAENGENALAIFEEHRPSIVLTDIKMPGMDGVQLLKELKSRNQDVEVVMITGHGDLDLAIQSLQLDAADFVTKPINDEILEASLKRVEERLNLKREIRRYTQDLERMVEEKSRRYRDLFERVPCYITVQDPDFRITDANERFRAHFGAGQGELCHQVYKDRDTPCEKCPVARTFADGESHEVEEVVTDLQGNQRYVLINTAPLAGPDGAVEQVMELSTDITQIRTLQDRLTNLGLLLGSVSHGVKGLLTALDGSIYRLKSGLKRGDPERMENALTAVDETADRIKRMVLDILYYAKSRDLNWAEVEVAALAEQTVKAAQPKAERQKVELLTEFHPDLSTMEADHSLLSSALVNLLENAVDACTSDTAKKEHRIVYEVRPEGDEYVFSVSDDGTGMDAETRNKIFSLFFSSKGKKGTGLGLFIANQVVEQHGGRIDVNSSPGQGSCFDVILPRVLPDAAKTPAEEDEDSGGSGATGEA